jgi:Protein of unknown function (DUF2970)
MSDPQPHSPSKPAGFLRVVVAVLWAFLGIRKRQGADQDRVAIKPAHVIVAGVIGGLLFIAILITVVRLIVTR